MGIWNTKRGDIIVNIMQQQINAMKKKGAQFCRMKDNPEIQNENSEWYENFTCKDFEGDSDKTSRRLKHDITVTSVNGNNVTGYISHWVNGPCAATPERDWFIIQPGKQPTQHKM